MPQAQQRVGSHKEQICLDSDYRITSPLFLNETNVRIYFGVKSVRYVHVVYQQVFYDRHDSSEMISIYRRI